MIKVDNKIPFTDLDAMLEDVKVQKEPRSLDEYKKGLNPLLAGIGAAIIGTTAEGAAILQFTNIPGGSENVELLTHMLNDDVGAIYNSGHMILYNILGDYLWAKPQNQLLFGSKEEMMSRWNIGLSDDGQVYNGWSATPDANGTAWLDHAPFGYTEWRDNVNHPDQHLAVTYAIIPIHDFHLQPGQYIGTNPNAVVPNAFEASAGDGLNYWHADGLEWQVIPEPSTAALLILGAAAFKARKLVHGLTDKVTG